MTEAKPTAAKPKAQSRKAGAAAPDALPPEVVPPEVVVPEVVVPEVVAGGRTKSAAAWAHDRLVLYIRNFESQLDQSQEIAMGFAGSDAGILRIEGIGWFDPDLVSFYGRDEEGLKTQLIQHVSQLNVMLRAVPKLAPEAPPNRIGFRLTSGWQGGEAGDGSVWTSLASGTASDG